MYTCSGNGQRYSSIRDSSKRSRELHVIHCGAHKAYLEIGLLARLSTCLPVCCLLGPAPPRAQGWSLIEHALDDDESCIGLESFP